MVMGQQSLSVLMYFVQLGFQKYAVNRKTASTDGKMRHAHTHLKKELKMGVMP